MLKTTAVFIMAAIMGYNTSFAQTATKKAKHVNTVQVAKDTLVNVGGAEMDPSKNIVENASKSSDHTTLVSAVTEAGLVSTLEGAGPFTVFAPTNEAFEMVGHVGVDSLMLPANKEKLSQILTYHVVSGKFTAKDLLDLIAKNNGRAELKTVEGGTLTVMQQGKKLYLVDEKGGKSWITIADVFQSNGVIHVINTVLMPN